MVGFDISQVVSDKSHYQTFICKICQNLSSLEAVVVTSPCNHPFCRSCLIDCMRDRIAEGLTCKCPVCRQTIETDEPTTQTETTSRNNNNNNNNSQSALQVNEHVWISASSLEEVQPLAFQCLQLVQVRCCTSDDNNHNTTTTSTTTSQQNGKNTQPCYWTGNYGDLKTHLVEHNVTAIRTPPPPIMSSTSATTDSVSNNPKTSPSMEAPVLYGEGGGGGEDVSRIGGATQRGDATGAHHLRDVDTAQPRKAVDPADLHRAMDRCDKLKKQANAKFNRGDVEGARILYSEGLALISDFPCDINNRDDDELRIMVASLYSNRAVTFYRERILLPSVEDCDKSLALDPKCEKTYIRKWRALDAMGRFEEATACLETGTRALPTSSKLQEQLRKSKAPPTAPSSRTISSASDMDMGRSIASMSYAFERETIASKGGHEMDISVVGDPSHSVLDRAERLKKQANAKFNKGDIESARALYSDALGCIPKNGNYSQGVKALLSELYSNRAVTYYRNKQYQESLSDCEHAIDLDPDSEKSYIRKGRALVGLDRNDDALLCMQAAARRYPKSKKIKEELSKMTEQVESGTAKGGSNESVNFDNSVGSFSNIYATPADGSRSAAAATLSTGHENLTYAEELELADKLKRNANAKFNRGDIAGARLLYTEALACLPNDRENEAVRSCLASLYANRAVTFYREKQYGPSIWDCDKAIELEPKVDKSYSRKARALASLKRYDEAILCLEEGKKQIPGSSKLEEELIKIKEEQAADDTPVSPNSKMFADQARKDFQVSYNSASEFNASSSANFFVTPGGPKAAMYSVPEGQSQEFDLPMNQNAEEFERAEKLKKQANAKLNKGDVSGARVLYGEGLACLPPGSDRTPDGRELAASLYANRAVTFFREKRFAETVNDCNKSIEYDPHHEKSYIRKWRALMALGNFEDACKCLESAVKEIPNSERLNEELANAKEQQQLLKTINELIAARDYQEARDTLKPIVKTSDNVSLWLAAARVDACLGLTESALERVHKVLLFNPKHAEALQVRGYATFLSGEMDHGVSILKDSLEADIETANQDASRALQDCQQLLQAFSKGQQKVKRGRYKEAVELFTSALNDGEKIPNQAPLYGIIMTERAEANLLCDLYDDALHDCNEAIAQRHDNLTAWTVKIEVYFALGRLQEARDELAIVRKTWGAGNETIEDAFKKTDFELRLKKTDDELHLLAASVEAGVPPSDDQGPLHMNFADRRASESKSPRATPIRTLSKDNRRSSSRSKRDLGLNFGKQNSKSREKGGRASS
ncbi:peptidase C14 caspase catalytic subunit-like protein [Nitzschia inconspicua]|uniref:Peptidase C14 caspase catalytic subunit-like protein n=1 Tax=Nitzschia inconspicua TaxID=303405 RepID=A0A9K3PQ08_9STRA|nr:peptidase C14 caspase catalytic subunit-like protein [Nitzschia inconspicua]